MKRVLVICMSRMGDTLQAIPVFKALKENSAAHVSVLVRKTYSVAVGECKYIDDLILFDSKMMIADAVSGCAADYRKRLASFIEELNARNFDELVNLTFSPASAHITSLIKAKIKKGLNVSSDGITYHEGMWSSYFNGAVLNRTLNNINLVDIFLNIAGQGEARENLRNLASVSKCKGLFNHELIEKDDYVIAFQMGASDENKRWPVRSFSGLAKLILRDGYFPQEKLKLLLIGGTGEEILGDDFLYEMKDCGLEKRVVNFIGKTSISDLWGILSRSNMFVTNDTGPMHIATAIGTPVINLSLGPVKFQETGPYSMDSIIITPNISCYPCSFQHKCFSPECKAYIKPHDVYEAVKALDEIMLGKGSCNNSEKLFMDNISNYSNFYRFQKIDRKNSPRIMSPVPISRQKLTEASLSEIACNAAIGLNLKFSRDCLGEIFDCIERYDISDLDFAGYLDSHLQGFRKMLALLKRAKKKNANIKRLCIGGAERKHSARMEAMSTELFNLEVEIARHQNDNNISSYLLGLFLAFKASNIGPFKKQVQRNQEIYNYLFSAVETMGFICKSIFRKYEVGNILGEHKTDRSCLEEDDPLSQKLVI